VHPEGRELGWIRLPGNLRTTNVAFAVRDMRTLYITNRSKDLYTVRLNVVGFQ
jgi:sugar lactone lactonase YvrE